MTVVRLRSARLLAHPKLNDIHPRAWLPDVLARLPVPPESAFTNSYLRNWRPQNVRSRGVSVFQLAANPGLSVEMIESFCGKRRMRDTKMATEVTKFRGR
jgi:hypothetical protein